MNNLPIGVFDSGVGGLTVLKALQEALPHENFLYLGDTARLPYGTKSAQTVTHYAASCAHLLKTRGIKLLVVACNTAASVALEALEADFHPIPVVGVIVPGATAACASSKTHHITVLATQGTVQWHAYKKAIEQMHLQAKVEEWPCSLLVSLAEEGWTSGALVEAIIAKILEPVLVDNKSDTFVLGCTHFPVLQKAIQNVIGDKITIVDSAHTTAKTVKQLIETHELANAQSVAGRCHFMATDNIARFKKMASIFLESDLNETELELVNIHQAGT